MTSGPGAHPASQFHQEETERGAKASCSAQGRGLQDEGRCRQEDRTPRPALPSSKEGEPGLECSWANL